MPDFDADANRSDAWAGHKEKIMAVKFNPRSARSTAALLAFSLTAQVFPARGETLDLVCSLATAADTVNLRLLIDTDNRSATEIWSSGPSSGKSYQYPITEATGEFIKYADVTDQRTRNVTIDRVVGTINVRRVEANGRTENISYPCRRGTRKF